MWLEDDCFGSTNTVPEEELMVLKEIFFAKLKQHDLGKSKYFNSKVYYGHT